MTSWHYRILSHPHGHLVLHEVYCDEAGKPTSYTGSPVIFMADEDEGAAGIVASPEKALKDARERPILNMSELEPQAEPGEENAS